MSWAFRILVTLNGLLLAVLFLYKASGEDPAGEGMRLGVATLMAIAFALIVAGYWFVKWNPFRVVMLLLLAVPIVITAYGVLLMLG
jgi:hypothetical protein